jgi:hypothetical protein
MRQCLVRGVGVFQGAVKSEVLVCWLIVGGLPLVRDASSTPVHNA